jgi:hypothetical protein
MASKNEFGLYVEEVDGKKYEFEKWDAEDSVDALLDIAGLIGEPLGAAFGAFVQDMDEVSIKTLLDKDFDPQIVTKIMASLTGGFKGPNKEIVKALLRKLSSGPKVRCEGKPVTFGTHYREDLSLMFKVAKAGLEVQLGSFFVVLREVGKLSQKPITNQASPT